MQARHAPLAGVAACFCLLLSTRCTPAAPRYIFTDLGRLPDGPNEVIPSRINQSGQVTGYSGANFTANGYHGFLWTPNVPNGATGNMIDLGDLPGGDSFSAGNAINSFGQVTGISDTSNDPFIDPHAFLWTPTSANGTNGSLMDLGALSGSFDTSYGQSINSYGQVAGLSRLGTNTRGFAWTPTTPNGTSGSMVDIGALPYGNGDSSAAGINDVGQITGDSNNASGNTHAFLWSPAQANGSTGTMVDLGDLPGGYDLSQADAINNRGQVTGGSFTAAGSRAYLWSPNSPNDSTGTMLDLGVPSWATDTRGLAINSRGDVVGEAKTLDRFGAFLWTAEEGMLDLQTLVDFDPAWTFVRATGINDAGQIVGFGYYDPDLVYIGNRRAFLLTPIPEPASIAAITLLGAMLICRRRRG
jgi:probable HAF family extracellular repeat protein